jgi:pyruvate/2-oxoglutarate dehydrogenase complex dihydrolipoamide dehydrogenase (E3) component
MNVVVVGGGPAGIAAAVHAHGLGADVTLLERERLGGVCYNEGPVPVRTLARAARMLRDAGAWGDFGLVGVPPRVDLHLALASVTRTVDHIYEVKHAAERLRDDGIDVVEGIGTVRFVDPSTVAVPGGRLFHGDRIILAVGGHDRRLPLPGAELGLSYRGVLHLDSLPASIVVIGGADTGCKLASIFEAFGCHVTVVEVAPRLIPKSDSDLGEALARAFVARGMDIRTDCRTERLERVGNGIAVHISSGGHATTVKGDAVFFAVGWPGNLEELALDVAGIETARGYIRVNGQLRTSQPHVFAIGDVNGLRKLVEPAVQQGRVAAENAVLGSGRDYTTGTTPVGGFTDPEYASVGMTEAEARAHHDCVVGMQDYRLLTRAVVDGRSDGFCKLIAARESGVILGAHVLGEYSAELIQVAAVCMAAQMSVRRIAELQLAYPTFTQAIGVVALHLARELDLMPRRTAFESAELSEASA